MRVVGSFTSRGTRSRPSVYKIDGLAADRVDEYKGRIASAFSKGGKVTEKELKDFLRKSAEESWDATGEPYLLSSVATDLKKQGVDYRSALPADERLKSFAERVQEADLMFKVVQHPSHKAKVGIIPFDKTFAFPAEPREERKAATAGRSRNEQVLLSFFDVLQGLPDDVLDDVHIPAKAIVLILRKR